MWATAGEKTDPTDGDILADTGPLTLGITGGIIITSTTPITVELVKRNAANDADVAKHPLPVGAYVLFLNNLPLGISMNQRYLLRLVGTVTGENKVQASILW